MSFFSSIEHAISDVGEAIGHGLKDVAKGVGAAMGGIVHGAIEPIFNNTIAWVGNHAEVITNTLVEEFVGYVLSAEFSKYLSGLLSASKSAVHETWEEAAKAAVEKYLSGKISSTGSFIGELMTDILGSLGSELGSVWDKFGNTFGTIFNKLNGEIGSISQGIESVVNPIRKAVEAVTSTEQAINDKIVTPIRDLITAYNKVTTTSLTTITQDLHQGIQGFLKLPGDITNALTSVDAQFARATQALGSANANIVKESLVPGLSTGIGEHIDKIHTALLGPEFKPTTGSDIVQLIRLEKDQSPAPLVKLLEKLEDEMENHTGFFGDVIAGMYHMLQLGDFVFRQMTISLEPYFQEAKKSIPAELLPVAAATEAYRRGIITADAWQEELARQGFSYERQMVINELTNFYFKERDAVALYQRGIIDNDAFFHLMRQNNVGDDQAMTLIELMQHVLNPADIAAGVARGYISLDQASNMYKAALVPEQLRDIIPELEKSLVNPVKMTKLRARKVQADKGFLSETLLSSIPWELKQQFDRMQAEDGAAELEWLGHFDIPQARWWCVAYFRGLVTLTQVEQAFAALNIPKELWYDIIDTERELPPVWLVPDIVKTGVWEKDKAIPTLMKLGFSEENATVLYEYGAAQVTTANKQAAESLSKLSLGNAKEAFDDGLIDAKTYKDVLLAHNYDEASAELTVELAEYNLAVSQQKTNADTIISAVRLGQISEEQAQSELYSLQLTTAQVENYLNKLEAAKRANAKLPSVSMLEGMAKKGIINAQTAVETLVILGYSELWSMNIIKTWE